MLKKVFYLVLKILLNILDLNLVPSLFAAFPFLLTPIVLGLSFRYTVENSTAQKIKFYFFLIFVTGLIFDSFSNLKFGFWILTFLLLFLLGLLLNMIILQKEILMIVFSAIIFSTIIFVSNYPKYSSLSLTSLILSLILELTIAYSASLVCSSISKPNRLLFDN